MLKFGSPVGAVAEPVSGRAMTEIAVLVAVSALVAAGAIAASGLKFANAEPFFVPLCGLLGFLAAINLYQYIRMPENTKLIMFINMVMIYLVMSVTMMTYQYALAMQKAYPITDLIERMDQRVGFNWLEFTIGVHRVPYLSEIIGFCYKNWMREFVVVFILLSFLGKFDRLYEFTGNYIVAGMVTLSVSGILNSRSLEGVSSYAIAGLHHPSSSFGPEYLLKLDHLRRGLDNVMDFDKIIGLVAFPSFHAGAAVLLATATRDLKGFSAPFLLFNIMILIGTITEGGHNLTDVIGGCAFAIAAIAAAQALRRSGAWFHVLLSMPLAASRLGFVPGGRRQQIRVTPTRDGKRWTLTAVGGHRSRSAFLFVS